MMARRIRSALPAAATVLVAATLTAAPLPALAGGTRSFELEDFSSFDAGETEGAAIEASGKVTVGFTPARGAPEDATSAFTCLGRRSDVLVGTSDEAAIHRVSLGSRGKDKGKVQVERLAKLSGVVVTAMVELSGGDLVVATLPGGKLQRVTAKGKVSDFAELPVEQIWALTVHDAKLYAGTGPKGELFEMSLSGKDPKVVLDDSDKHVMSLLSVGDVLLAGTAPGARLLQVGDEPEGLLLNDFSGDELRDMVTTRQGLLVAVNTFEDRNLGSADALAQNLARSSISGPPPSGDLDQQRPAKADAAVYHVDLGKGRDVARASEAPWEEWLTRDGQYFTSLLALDDVGTVLVASSAEGKVYRMRGPRDAATVADFEERQATDLCRAASGPIFATAGQGAAAYHLLSSPAKKARYRTKVLDAKQPSSFGALALRGKGPLTARARTGPSDEPNERWSKWTDVKLQTEPAGLMRGELTGVRQRRYLQLEVSLGSPDAELRGLEQFYAPENLAPLMTNVELSRPSFDDDDLKEPSAKVTIRWKVDARDDDDLEFGVRARPEGTGETQWIPLHDSDEPVTTRELSWDLSTVPDGIYEVEVVASDEPSNGAGRARTDQLRSPPFVVDRRRPTIDDLRYGAGKLSATVRDDGTYVHDAAVKVDDGPFRSIAAADGIFDEPDEVISTVLDRVEPGLHRVVLRVRDAFGNIESAAILATVE